MRVGCVDPECIRAKREASVDDVRALFNVSPGVAVSPAVGPGKDIEAYPQDGHKWFKKWMQLRERRDFVRGARSIWRRRFI